MPANINSFARRGGTDAPWHGIAGQWDENATMDEIAAAAGMNWRVEDSPVFYRHGNSARMTTEKKVFFRSDNPDTVISVMSDKFQPVQPREALEFYDQISDELGIRMNTAGCLGNGAKFWALADTGEKVNIGGSDEVKNYLMFATANDGSMATRIGGTNVRVVCQNTLSAALSADGAGMLTINHRSRIDWGRARAWVEGEQREFEAFAGIAGALAQVHVDAKQGLEFARALVAPDWDPRNDKTPRKLQKLVDTLATGVGQHTPTADGTAWGLLNGVTRFVDHEKQAHSQSTRLDSALFGQGNNLKNAALDLLVRNCVEKYQGGEVLVPVLAGTKYQQLAA